MVPLVELRSVTSTCQPVRVTRRWVREITPSALGSLTTCGLSSPLEPVKSAGGLRPRMTSRSSVTTSPVDRRSTPRTGRGTMTGSGGSAAPHWRQAASLGGLTCPAGQIRAGTGGPIRSGGGSGRATGSARLTVSPSSSGPRAGGGATTSAGLWCAGGGPGAPGPAPHDTASMSLSGPSGPGGAAAGSGPLSSGGVAQCPFDEPDGGSQGLAIGGASGPGAEDAASGSREPPDGWNQPSVAGGLATASAGLIAASSTDRLIVEPQEKSYSLPSPAGSDGRPGASAGSAVSVVSGWAGAPTAAPASGEASTGDPAPEPSPPESTTPGVPAPGVPPTELAAPELPPTEVTTPELSAIQLPTTELPAPELPATELTPTELSASELPEPELPGPG